MKSKFLALIIAAGIFSAHVEQSYADTCSDNLVKAKVFSPATANAFCTFFATSIPTDASFLTGKTISIQEATAASKCSGTITANGTTAVTVSTTCATAGSRILLTRSSAPSGTAICWQTNIVAGTSFDLDCSGAETGTFDFLIVHEAP